MLGKNKTRLLVVGLMGALCLWTLTARAQQIQCAEVVKKAMQQLKDKCETVGRNKVCYASGVIKAEPLDATKTLIFNAPGDTAGLGDFKRLTLNPYDSKAGVWSVALMRLQANFPDSMPGQAVTMMLMGDTEFGADATAKKGAQAYYFRSGSGALACKEMPSDGILLESPAGKQPAKLTLNGIDLDIGSKVFLQLQKMPDKPTKTGMAIFTLKGSVKVTAKGMTQTVMPGYVVDVGLNDALIADEAPGEPEEDAPPGNEFLPVDVIEAANSAFITEVGGSDPTPAMDTTLEPGTGSDAPPVSPSSDPNPPTDESPEAPE